MYINCVISRKELLSSVQDCYLIINFCNYCY